LNYYCRNNPIGLEKKMKTLSVFPVSYRWGDNPNTIQNALGNFEKYFDSFFGDSLLSPAGRITGQLPAVDILENESTYVLEMELPGLDDKDIDVHVDGSSLTITSKQEEAKNGENQGTYILRERKTNTFTRSFKLPEKADPESVSAGFKNGVLKLEIKKRSEAQKRVIQINAA
jgi:HSP20 family protein